MKRSRFAVQYPPPRRHPIHRAIGEGTSITRMELLQWGPRSAITSLSWYDGDPDAVRAVLSGVDSVTTTELVADDDGTYAFLRQDAYEFDDALLDLITEAGVVFLPPITFRESGAASFEAVGEAARLSAFHETLSERLDTRIERVTDFHRHSSSAAVTDRQRAAIEAAVSVGYYEVPRTGTVADVAAMLDCTTSTAGELLRKGEAAIVRSFATSR